VGLENSTHLHSTETSACFRKVGRVLETQRPEQQVAQATDRFFLSTRTKKSGFREPFWRIDM
jgi:hypothetical protein